MAGSAGSDEHPTDIKLIDPGRRIQASGHPRISDCFFWRSDWRILGRRFRIGLPMNASGSIRTSHSSRFLGDRAIGSWIREFHSAGVPAAWGFDRPPAAIAGDSASSVRSGSVRVLILANRGEDCDGL
jgi:hypothetical protein